MFEKHIFIKLNRSNLPGVIIDSFDNHTSFLVSLLEYQGDYIFTQLNDMSKVILNPEEKLSILGKFGDWFYSQHSDIFQQVILENLQIYHNNY